MDECTLGQMTASTYHRRKKSKVFMTQSILGLSLIHIQMCIRDRTDIVLYSDGSLSAVPQCNFDYKTESRDHINSSGIKYFQKIASRIKGDHIMNENVRNEQRDHFIDSRKYLQNKMGSYQDLRTASRDHINRSRKQRVQQNGII